MWLSSCENVSGLTPIYFPPFILNTSGRGQNMSISGFVSWFPGVVLNSWKKWAVQALRMNFSLNGRNLKWVTRLRKSKQVNCLQICFFCLAALASRSSLLQGGIVYGSWKTAKRPTFFWCIRLNYCQEAEPIFGVGIVINGSSDDSCSHPKRISGFFSFLFFPRTKNRRSYWWATVEGSAPKRVEGTLDFMWNRGTS